MEGKFPSKILASMTAATHNCNNFFCWSQMFHILPSICEGFILLSEIGFFERAFWVSQKFFIAKRHFSCSSMAWIIWCLQLYLLIWIFFSLSLFYKFFILSPKKVIYSLSCNSWYVFWWSFFSSHTIPLTPSYSFGLIFIWVNP